MPEETQPLTGPQALHAAQVMERMAEEARDLLLVTNMDIASSELATCPKEVAKAQFHVLLAARNALLSRLSTLRDERDELKAKLEEDQVLTATPLKPREWILTMNADGEAVVYSGPHFDEEEMPLVREVFRGEASEPSAPKEKGSAQ